MTLHVSSTCDDTRGCVMQVWPPDDEHMCSKHCLWYHHTYRCDDTRGCVMQVWPPDDEHMCSKHCLWYHHTYRCDDTRGSVMQVWPPDDKHMCSKHVEAWNKLIVKQKFCASSWLITEINRFYLFLIIYKLTCCDHMESFRLYCNAECFRLYS